MTPIHLQIKTRTPLTSMNNKTLVAVIIPTLNEELFITKCLESVLSQTFPLEYMDILVIDGGSNDNTEDIVNKFIDKYDNIRLLHNSKKIQSAAFNLGVENTSAPYIIRLDAHATYEKHYIERCINGLIDHPECGNVGGIWDIKPQNNSIQAKANAIINQLKFGIGGASYRIGTVAGYVDTVPFGAFPRKLIEGIGGMREDLPRGEDNEYNSRIKKNGYKIYLDPSIQCTYFARGSIIKSIKQMYSNGLSVGHLINIDKNSVSVRHLIPLTFVISLILLLIGGFIIKTLWYLLCIELAIYILIDIIVSLKASLKFGFQYYPILIFFFPLIHISYGIGTMIGLLKKPNL